LEGGDANLVVLNAQVDFISDFQVKSRAERGWDHDPAFSLDTSATLKIYVGHVPSCATRIPKVAQKLLASLFL
jgi:hypothetical protein